MKTGTGSAIGCTATQPVPLLLAVPVPVFIRRKMDQCPTTPVNRPFSCDLPIPRFRSFQGETRMPRPSHRLCWIAGLVFLAISGPNSRNADAAADDSPFDYFQQFVERRGTEGLSERRAMAPDNSIYWRQERAAIPFWQDLRRSAAGKRKPRWKAGCR